MGQREISDLLFQRASKVADMYGNQIDQPNMASGRYTATNDPEFRQGFNELTNPQSSGYVPEDIGVLQNPPQYYGSRLVLPQTGGSYGAVPSVAGQEMGLPRMPTGGTVGGGYDPHNNGFQAVPETQPMDQNALQQAVYGYLIQRGYPVYSGSGEGGGLPTKEIFGFGQK